MAVRKTKEGANLKRWFKEKWVDVRTGKPCGRTKGEKRGTPYCRPSKKITSKTITSTKRFSSVELNPLAKQEMLKFIEEQLINDLINNPHEVDVEFKL